MSARKRIKLQLRFQGRILERKAVFFRPCPQEQISEAIRVVCDLPSSTSLTLLDDEGDVMCISDSLEPGLYEVSVSSGLKASSTSSFLTINSTVGRTRCVESASKLSSSRGGSSASGDSFVTNYRAGYQGQSQNSNLGQEPARNRNARRGSRLGGAMDASSSDLTGWERRENQARREELASRSSRAASNIAFDGLTFQYLFKFIIVGNMSVGKSCLLMQFTDGLFKESHEATIGVDFGSQIIPIEGVPIKIQIWDTAGQEDFRAITRAYYREACAALLVYDVTSRQSFTEIQMWLKAVRNNATNSNIVLSLVGNKVDLCGRLTGGDRRRVKRSEGEHFADSNGLLYMESSAKTGENVQEVFHMTAAAVFQRLRDGYISTDDPASGVRVGSASSSAGSYRAGSRRGSGAYGNQDLCRRASLRDDGDRRQWKSGKQGCC